MSLAEKATKEIDSLADKDVDSTDTELRYMAYGARLRTALRASHRYIAYTSDVGEAFRPLITPAVVKAAYGISWLYLSADVSYEAYKAHKRGPSPSEAAHLSEPTRIGLVAVKRALFQSIASMALPAFTIHTIVARSKPLFSRNKHPRLRTWGPTVVGLSVVPILPYLFDKPVEHAIDRAWEWMEARTLPTGSPKKRERGDNPR
ncbi:mitochondrial 18 KDa protein-domain-containing protein [Pisolithus croceorrhizus]|nr:mitochondrial 18 KDa protein-domain-containing protein [Pisolithus croceorrhizus]KAI6128510.1 mitochondrial 18 KDa protein-domain-containing protein [Pisolithus croceorrhizus]